MRPWFVMRCRAGKEIEAEKGIRALGIEAMAPYREVWHRVRKGRPWKRRHALFPGYAFVALEDIGAGWLAIQRALNTEDDRVAIRMLPTSDNPAAINPKDVLYLASIADGKYQVGEDDLRALRVGDDVLIPEGPLKGFVGTILSIKRGKKATIEVKQVKLSSSLEIPLANLEKV